MADAKTGMENIHSEPGESCNARNKGSVWGKKTTHKTNQNSSMIWVCQRNTEDNS